MDTEQLKAIYEDVASKFEDIYGFRPDPGTKADELVRAMADAVLAYVQVAEAFMLPVIAVSSLDSHFNQHQ